MLILIMNLTSKEKKWVAVYTKPRHERVVAENLIDKGLEVYLPLLKERRKWSDRKIWIKRPLFKSYLFVRVQLRDSIFVLKTPGIVRIIKFGGEIAIVNNSSISAIKLMLEGGYKPEPTDYFIKGDKVKVVIGPLKGIEGEIAKIHDNSRLIIRIDSIQHSLSIKINSGLLKKIE